MTFRFRRSNKDSARGLSSQNAVFDGIANVPMKWKSEWADNGLEVGTGTYMPFFVK